MEANNEKEKKSGFTLVELLVSMVIFTLVLLAVYFLFDQGRWYYLAADKRSNIQENGRLAMEQMERDFRMVGYGVPSGEDSGGSTWTALFDGRVDHLGFAGDIDNGAQILKFNVGTDSNHEIFVEDTSHYANASSSPEKIIVVNNRKTWEATVVTGLDSNDTALSTTPDVPNASGFPADRSEVYTLEKICYRYNPSTTYPYGTLERAVISANDPTDANATSCDGSAFTNAYTTIATNIFSLKFQYFVGTAEQTTLPLSVTDSKSTDHIQIVMKLRDRSHGLSTASGNATQDVDLQSIVLLRERKS
jgi:prepilin-type N-terminal cleavage/methylation domain-containing protein